MAQFTLTDDLHTGSRLIDGDHRRLIGLVNLLLKAMEGVQGPERISEAMTNLVAYTEEHFGREEAEMERIQYVASLAHQTEHAKLLKQLVELKAILDAGGRINEPAVAEFLGEWLRDHILSTDMKLAAALKLRSAPAPLAQLH
ncbi:MAG: hypothetical protein D4R74_10955 [Betaproteobacteria bacterium]|nr:MAG: hypothetical protein D4R74_10955 [Betaproteobacteria bacterium]